jgi:lysophospholipase L1-like esterase
MKSRTIAKISRIVKIVFICGAFFYSYKFYPNIQQKRFPNPLSEVKEGNLKDKVSDSVQYYHISELDIIGKLPLTETYSRLPQEAKDKVRQPVWNLSKKTAGISIRFTSNTTAVKLRWTLSSNVIMSNMTPIASKGFDLYAYRNGKWQFAGVARPQNSITNQAVIIDGMQQEDREYLLNLPLYDGVVSAEIGIDQNAYIKKPVNHIIDKTNPIIFYGTSITQGASASRPGLTYAALIQRKLNKEVINLGFSGNGRFEKEVAEYFMKASPSLIVLDCTPNSSADIIRKNLPQLLKYVRSINDTVPIIFIESIIRDFAYFKEDNEKAFGSISFINQQNTALSEIYSEFSANDDNLYYLKKDDLIGNDNEATLDGTHFNDLGHFRAYEKLTEKIKEIILL